MNSKTCVYCDQTLDGDYVVAKSDNSLKFCKLGCAAHYATQYNDTGILLDGFMVIEEDYQKYQCRCGYVDTLDCFTGTEHDGDVIGTCPNCGVNGVLFEVACVDDEEEDLI